ncbi:thiamine phosphate synthase [Lactobacillaceae bacterium L1_55_11]|nr:thiamine phosphate synthase [Lactobacillaceae bacterium L1_55_11]
MSKNFKPSDLAVYFIGGSQNTGGDVDQFLTQLERACQSGVTIFQFREKDQGSLSGAAREQLGQQVRAITKKYQIPLIVDDDVALAEKIQADGLHLGQGDEDIHAIARDHLDWILGLSVHDLDELEASGDLTAIDYLGLGPVAATSSKDQVQAPIGLTGLTQLVQAVPDLPTVAIGGITPANAAAVLQTGVSGLAVISALMQSTNLPKTIAQLKGA